jgi:hypothetical protein
MFLVVWLPGFGVLGGFLRGVLEIAGVLWWYFDGENVVECVKNVVKRWSLFGS